MGLTSGNACWSVIALNSVDKIPTCVGIVRWRSRRVVPNFGKVGHIALTDQPLLFHKAGDLLVTPMGRSGRDREFCGVSRWFSRSHVGLRRTRRKWLRFGAASAMKWSVQG